MPVYRRNTAARHEQGRILMLESLLNVSGLPFVGIVHEAMHCLRYRIHTGIGREIELVRFANSIEK